MKLKILVDNNTYIDEYYYGEPGFCVYIEDEGERILMDTGYSGVALDNARAMAISLDGLDAVVLSHGHDNHTGGLCRLIAEHDTQGTALVAHPLALEPKTIRDRAAGCPAAREELEKAFDVRLSKKPVRLTENIAFLGEIPTFFDFEERRPLGSSCGEPDLLMDDTAIACRTENGLFIVTGCSHSGICSIVEYAKRVCAEERVLGVLGGFHLREMNDKARGAIDYFAQLKQSYLCPCHCVSFPVKAAMHKRSEVTEVGVGMELTLI